MSRIGPNWTRNLKFQFKYNWVNMKSKLVYCYELKYKRISHLISIDIKQVVFTCNWCTTIKHKRNGLPLKPVGLYGSVERSDECGADDKYKSKKNDVRARV